MASFFRIFLSKRKILFDMNHFVVRQYMNIAIRKNFLPFPKSPFFSKKVRKGYPSEMVKRVEQAEEWRKKEEGEKRFVRSNGSLLVGHLFRRENAKRLIILFHGWRSGWRAECIFPAMKLYESGASILIVEQRAHDKSEGKYIGFGILERFDCLAWCYAMVEEFSELDVYLMGFSMGAATLLLSADLDFPKNVKGMIADSGYRSPMDMVRRFASQNLHVNDEKLINEVNEMCSHLAGYRFTDRTASDSLKNAKLPIFFVHGTKDTMVPYGDTLLNYEDCASRKEMFILKGAGHGESFFRQPNLYLQKISDFFQW